MEQGTSLSGFLARLGGGRNGTQDSARSSTQPGTNGGAVAAGTGADQSISTKAFSRFLAALKHREAPVLLDLGPVVGSNINYFGERLGCKFFIEDVYANLEKYARENRTKELAEFFKSRFPQGDASFDGILCWDIFDYLDKASAQALARELVRMLRPDAVLFALFNVVEAATKAPPGFTRYVVADRQQLQYRAYRGARGKQRPLSPRDIQRLFEPLHIYEQFLLKNNLREVLFRKPSAEKTTTEGGPASHRAAD